MATHTKPDGSPFTPFAAAVLAWRSGGRGSDRAYAAGVVIHEEIPESGRQRVSLWLNQAMSGLDGTKMIPLPTSGPKAVRECPPDQAWAPLVQEFEREIAQELGEEWKAEIRLSAFTDRPEKIRRV